MFPTFWSSLSSYGFTSRCIMQVEFPVERSEKTRLSHKFVRLQENLLVGMLTKGMLANLPELHSVCVARHETSFIARNACHCGSTRGISKRNSRSSQRDAFFIRVCFCYLQILPLFTNMYLLIKKSLVNP